MKTTNQIFEEVLKELGFANYKPNQMTNSDYWLCTTEAMELYAQQRVKEVLDAEKVDIDFDGNVLARFTIQDGKLKITDAMNGYGHSIDVSKIKFKKVET